MYWIPLVAWLAGLVLAAAVLGFCTHEIVWKSRRLQCDLLQLKGVAGGFAEVQGLLAAAKQRLASTGVG